jgi:ribulose-5-phosphate 4-epimerase/fuculose-1-phosphate aldolase
VALGKTRCFRRAPDEGKKIAEALGNKKAVILQNHRLLTVGPTIEAAAWWFISMDNSSRGELHHRHIQHGGRQRNRVSPSRTTTQHTAK